MARLDPELGKKVFKGGEKAKSGSRLAVGWLEMTLCPQPFGESGRTGALKVPPDDDKLANVRLPQPFPSLAPSDGQGGQEEGGVPRTKTCFDFLVTIWDKDCASKRRPAVDVLKKETSVLDPFERDETKRVP